MPYSCKKRFSEIVCGCCLIFFCWINGLFAADATLDLKTLRSQAESGNKTAQFHLANRYFYGQDNCPVNRELAVYWFRKAAENGDDDAIRRVEELTGEKWLPDGLDVDPIDAEDEK